MPLAVLSPTASNSIEYEFAEDKQLTHVIHTAQMDKAGNVYYGQMDITLERGKVVSGTGTIDILGC